MTNFPLLFGVALIVNVTVTTVSSEWYKQYRRSQLQNGSGSGSSIISQDTQGMSPEEIDTKKRWHTLLRKYLIVYLLATMSDWLQGPYVYALYDKYKYSQHDIAVLFVAGFGSSMIFGSFIGGMADWGGRRTFVILFSVIYAASCFTKHFKNFSILMIGRLLGGIATSLLFSVFEAWLIRAHADANLKHMLGKSFSWAAYGNSVIAIVAGIVANKAANQFEMITIQDNFIYAGGYLNPFDIALAALVLCGFFAATLWEENYGDTSSSSSSSSSSSGDGSQSKGDSGKWYDGLRTAFIATMASPDIYLCGLMSSLFEGSMYIFVFMWTPALTGDEKDMELPFGLIFSTFMVSCMAGSSMFSIQVEKYKCEQLGVVVFAVASIAMAMVAFSNSTTMKFIAMNIFEMTVGMYFPIMGTLKGHIVPENKRAAIYNLFRIPLNFIVLFSLLTDLTPGTSFLLNSIMLASATVMMQILMKRRTMMGNSSTASSSHVVDTKDDEEMRLLDKDEEA